MSTGDIKANLRLLQTELKHVRYPKDIDYSSLAKGSPADFLTILHYVLCDFSRPVAQLILDESIDLVGKTDKKFMEAVYKVLRDLFSYKPSITIVQFFSRGFAEHKVIFVTRVVSLVKEKHRQLRKSAGASNKDSIRPSKKTSPPDVVASNESEKPLPLVIPGENLDSIVDPEGFRPSLNSTRSGASPVLPISQGITDTSVQIVVVGESVQEPCQSSSPVSENMQPVTVEKLDEVVTPRRGRRGAKGGQDTGYSTGETSPAGDAFYDSHLKNHPVINELAVHIADLINHVRTLEERLEGALLDHKKQEQNTQARVLHLEQRLEGVLQDHKRQEQNMQAKLILLENKCCILEGLIHQPTPFRKQPKSPVLRGVTSPGTFDHQSYSEVEEEDDDVIEVLETVEEEEDTPEEESLPVVFDNGLDDDGDANVGDEKKEDEEDEEDNGTDAPQREAQATQAERIQNMITDAEQMLAINSSLEAY